MKESLWGYWLIILGIFILSVMLLLQNYTTTNEQDVYLIKEITDAAMGDSLDLAHYRKYGEIRIIKEKFVENFIRRFSEKVGGGFELVRIMAERKKPDERNGISNTTPRRGKHQYHRAWNKFHSGGQ